MGNGSSVHVAPPSINAPAAENGKRRLVLAGAGHANVHVLKHFKLNAAPEDVELVLVTPERTTWYSGAIPASIAGLYSRAHAQVEVARVARWAGWRFVKASVVGVDGDASEITLSTGEKMRYTWLSINVGAQTRPPAHESIAAVAVRTRPPSMMEEKIYTFEDECSPLSVPHPRVVVVGSGAAGVELSLAVHRRFLLRYGAVTVVLVSRSPRLLNGLTNGVGDRMASVLQERGIEIYYNEEALRVREGDSSSEAESGEAQEGESTVSSDASDSVSVKAPIGHGAAEDESGDTSSLQHLVCSSGREVPFHLLLWATGPAPHDAFKEFSVAKSEWGFLDVNTALQSNSHPNVFAAGDCVTVKTLEWLPKAGVIAVSEGPILSHNLYACVQNTDTLKIFSSRKSRLQLLMTGDYSAVGCLGFVSFQGDWVWRWKDYLDRQWLLLYDLQRLGITEEESASGGESAAHEAQAVPKKELTNEEIEQLLESHCDGDSCSYTARKAMLAALKSSGDNSFKERSFTEETEAADLARDLHLIADSERWSAEQFLARLNEDPAALSVVDLRPEDEFERSGHVEGARNIPLRRIRQEAEALLKQSSEEKPLVLLCARGNDSQQARVYLQRAAEGQGQGEAAKTVKDVIGGMRLVWKAQQTQ